MTLPFIPALVLNGPLKRKSTERASAIPTLPVLILAGLLAMATAPLEAAESTRVDTLKSPGATILIDGQQPDSMSIPGVFEGWIRVDSTAESTRLAHRYIDPATLSAVSANGDTLALERDFSVDATLGVLRWKTVPPARVLVRYRFLPVTVTDTLFHRTLREARAADSLLKGETVELSDYRSSGKEGLLPGSTRLKRSGHITRGVQVGTGRDLGLESGLRLSLEGWLTRDVRVRALLDDSNLPVQPEGTSRRLEEIDQVYIDVQADRFNGRFGDYVLDFNDGRYGTINRRLEGGKVDYRAPGMELTAAGSVTRAQFHTNRFQGSDGVQGPYRLTGRNGESPILLVGGSERVWVDGIIRQRGESADYVIDYTRGELTFGTRLPITSESRIEVDFEYSPEVYPRVLYAGRTAFSTPGKLLQISANYLEEGDDAERPIGFDMTPEVRAALASQEDGTGRVAIPAADSLGPGKGDYVRHDTTWTDAKSYSIFIFIEPDADGRPQGEWSVLFSEVGAGKGDYRRNYNPLFGAYTFEWVGPGAGDYAPVRLMPLPERSRQAVMDIRFNPSDWFSLSSDMAASNYDRNTLAEIDNANTDGLAHNTSLTLQLPDGDNGPMLRADLHLRQEEAGYRPFARSREVEFDRNWGVDSLVSGEYEEETGVTISGQPLKDVRFNTSYGRLEHGGTTSSERGDGGVQVSGEKLNADIYAERILSRNSESGAHSDWARSRGSAQYNLGIWSPGVDFEWENRDAVLDGGGYGGHRYLRWAAAWKLTSWKGHSGVASFETRKRERQSDAEKYDPLYDENAVGATWAFRPMTLPWRSEVIVNHREKRFAAADSADITTDLASIQAFWNPLDGALTTDLRYRLSRTLARPSALIAYQVPVGEGEYVRVGDEYFYDPEIGDYILRSEPTGESLPTTDLAAALNMDWSPFRLPGGAGKHEGFGWEDISFVTNLEAAEITRWSRPSDIYLLRLNAFQTDSTVNGRLALRQEIHFFRNSRDFAVRIRYDAEKRLSNLYLSGAERYGSDAWGMRIRKALGRKMDLEGEGTTTRKLKRLARRLSTDRFLLNRAALTLSFRPTRQWNMSFTSRGLQDRLAADPDAVLGLGLRPSLTWNWSDKGRISADFEALWIETAMETVPFELADGRPKGRNGRGSLRADIRIGDYLTGRMVYTVRLDQGRKPIHLARMEVSAFF